VAANRHDVGEIVPIYEFRCTACGASFELLVRRSSTPAPCPSCGASEVEKLLSLPSVRSEETRSRAVRDIRARNRATRRAHDDAEVRRIEAHSEDHDD
jgi:putative FmdB family regulatory protein